MSALKHISSLFLVLMLIATSFAYASADTLYRSVEIDGMPYLIEDPGRFYQPRLVAKQAESLYLGLKDHPEIQTYVFLVNSSRTVDVLDDVTAEPKVFGDIRSCFFNSTTDYLRLDSIGKYGQYYYTTDHHWNYRGSYAGYCQIVRMLIGEDEPVLQPIETVTFPVRFNGSLNKNIHRTDSQEDFTVYRFEYPEMKLDIDGKPRNSYGNQESYFSGRFSFNDHTNHYNSFYGGEVGVLHVDTGRTDRKNIIVFSNSMSDALNLLLASHFHHTWIVDLKHYGKGNGSCYISRMLENWDADQILILGDGYYFSQSYIYQ